MYETAVFTPRRHQEEARDAILSARRAGRPGFLLGDVTGLGKTLSAWLALLGMPETEVLIICPKGAIAQWRRTIARTPPAPGRDPKSVTLLNFERTKTLMAPPAVSTRRSVRGRNNELARLGTLRKSWPLVVIDESHRIRNPSSQQGLVCRQAAAAAVFTIYMSATAGQSPFELSYLARLLRHGQSGTGSDMDEFRALLKRLKIAGARGRWKNWRWEPNARDRQAMSALLYKGSEAVGLRRRPEEIAGWPRVERALSPTAMDSPARRLYAATWREFRREFGLSGGSARRPAGWAADLRFRQKASLLRIPGTADFASDLLANGQAVAVSVAFLETGALMAETLRRAGWTVGEINGNHSGEANEAARVAFQTGRLDAVVFTVTESISLHQGEMPGDERERSLVIHDMRHSAIQLQQIEGRCHRDGRRAVIHYTYAEDTVEETIAGLVISRMADMDGIAGDDTALLDAIAAAVEAAARERAAA